MKRTLSSLLLLTSLTTAFNAAAVRKDIVITADIDHLVNMTLADGSPLPESMKMEYLPGANKLRPVEERVKFWSNAVNKPLSVSLEHDVILFHRDGDGKIPLTVRLDGKALSTTYTNLAFEDLFTGEVIENGSKPMTLSISQTDATPVMQSGHYIGDISITIVHTTI